MKFGFQKANHSPLDRLGPYPYTYYEASNRKSDPRVRPDEGAVLAIM